MKIVQTKERVLIIAAGTLLLSILLMIIIVPLVYTKTLTNEKNLDAVIGISSNYSSSTINYLVQNKIKKN